MNKHKDKYRELGQEIAPYLSSKFYYRDIANNVFLKKCSENYFDVNEIRFYKDYIIISNKHYNICHKTKIKNLINWESLSDFKKIVNNYQKLLKINETNNNSN